jgi:signal transduction histidine kinase
MNPEEKNQEIEQFVTALVHELRTPLSGARWAIESVMPTETDGNKDLLKQAYNKIIESINIVGDILRSSDPDTHFNFSDIKKEKVDLSLVVDDILKNLDFLIKEKGITLTYDQKDSATIYGNKQMLKLALTNIFDNAFRYSPHGTVFVSIVKNDGNSLVLTVKDSGIGIAPEDMQNIYKKFFRGDNAQKLDPGESGVGLYTTKKIIEEMHGGTMKVESELGHGTTFEVVFLLD